MLVGAPFGMKTSSIKALAQALGDMSSLGQGEHKVGGPRTHKQNISYFHQFSTFQRMKPIFGA